MRKAPVPYVHYTDAIAMRICDEIATGKSLRAVCRKKGMPSKEAVLKWLIKNPEFRDNYRQATEDRTNAMAEEIIEIADDSEGDWITLENGRKVIDMECVMRSRLRVDTRKWLMTKIMPKKYGERIEHTGNNLNVGPTIIFTGGPIIEGSLASEAVDGTAESSYGDLIWGRGGRG